MLMPMQGHSQPHCFWLTKADDGSVGMFVKDHSSTDESWLGAEGSSRKPFILLNPDTIPSPSEYESVLQNGVPNTLAAEEIKQLEQGLAACHPRMLITDPDDVNYSLCEERLSALKRASPVPFHWNNGGQYLKEVIADVGDPNIEDDTKEPPALSKRPRSILTSRKRRRLEMDEEEDDVKEAKYPVVGDMVVIKPDIDDKGRRFWIAKVVEITEQMEDGEPVTLSIHWFQAAKEFGKYTYLLHGRKKKKYLDTIEYASVIYRFDALTEKGYIPRTHETEILKTVEDAE